MTKQSVFNHLMVIAAVLLISSCSQKQFAFRKTIKVQNQELTSQKKSPLESNENVSLSSSTTEEIAVNPLLAQIENVQDTKYSEATEMKVSKVMVKENLLLPPHNPPVNSEVEKKSLQEKVQSKKREIQSKLDEGGSNGIAIAGFICSIVGLFIFGLILGTLGIIFSAIGMSRASKTGKGFGLAIAGLIIGIIGVILTLALASSL
jgi:hypothetical protein